MICKPTRAKCRNPRKVADLADALRPLGFTPIFAMMRKMASEELTPFEIAAPEIFLRTTDVFTSSDHERAVLVRSDPDESKTDGEQGVLDLVFLSREQSVDSLVKELREKFDIEFMPHSSTEAELIASVREQMSGIGPHGELLQNAALRTASKFLEEDDQLREEIKAVTAIFGTNPATREQLQKIPVFENNAAALDRIISTGTLSRKFETYCQSCRNPGLLFSTADEARRTIETSNCFCGNSRLTVGETFSFRSTTPAAPKDFGWSLWSAAP